jgi:hypothetical protein
MEIFAYEVLGGDFTSAREVSHIEEVPTNPESSARLVESTTAEFAILGVLGVIAIGLHLLNRNREKSTPKHTRQPEANYSDEC